MENVTDRGAIPILYYILYYDAGNDKMMLVYWKATNDWIYLFRVVNSTKIPILTFANVTTQKLRTDVATQLIVSRD